MTINKVLEYWPLPLVGASFFILAAAPGPATASAFIAMITAQTFLSTLKVWEATKQPRSASHSDIQAFTERLNQVEGKLTVLRTSLGLDSSNERSRPKISVFPSKEK